jgi:hypothetical protein
MIPPTLLFAKKLNCDFLTASKNFIRDLNRLSVLKYLFSGKPHTFTRIFSLDGKRGFFGAAIGKIKRGRGAKARDEKPAFAAATAGSQTQNRWFTLLLHYSILLFFRN